MRYRLRSGLISFSISIVLLWLASTIGPSARAGDAEPATDERVVVTSTRLDDQPSDKNDVPAHVTVLDRDAIERAGARNVQDLLAEVVGVNLCDQVGNDVQKTLDLRGFTGGKGIAVFVDGARVNDPRNNEVALEQVPLEAIERIEITRGSSAALAGGGSEAGVVRIVTRRGTAPAATLSAAAGSFGSQSYDGSYGRTFGRFDLFAAGTYDTSDGFRPNAGGDQTRWNATGGVDLGDGRRLVLAILSSHLDYGNPGALTQAEFEADPDQNQFNVLDFTNTRARQASLDYQGKAGGGFSVAADLSYRDEAASVLTTGRAAPTFGGFFLDSDTGTWSGTAQATRDDKLSRGSNLLAFGVELLDGSADTLGFFTVPASPGSYDPANPSSKNTAGARSGAVFVQDTWTITPRWVVTAGARGDRDRVRYDEAVPDTTIADSRTFSRASFRAGATFRPAESIEVYASYSDSFLPPTPEQLFAFPTFGSNPGLKPEIARSREIGSRLHRGSASFDAALFWIDTRDEIVFDPTPTASDPFGRNVNEGSTRRLGIELSARGHISRRLAAFAGATATDATLTAGANDGNEVPLVPRYRVAAGIDAELPAGFRVRADLLAVSSQVLDNDAGNTQSKLDGYTVANLRVAWERPLSRAAGSHAGRLGAFVEARNLFDERYATRGIYAFDFQTFSNAAFVTPAPGRRYLLGVSWRL
jgi:iron complex outermembrane receptor protein